MSDLLTQVKEVDTKEVQEARQIVEEATAMSKVIAAFLREPAAPKYQQVRQMFVEQLGESQEGSDLLWKAFEHSQMLGKKGDK